jgi:hypothetical protein
MISPDRTQSVGRRQEAGKKPDRKLVDIPPVLVDLVFAWSS